jgi:hypothetical protein
MTWFFVAIVVPCFRLFLNILTMQNIENITLTRLRNNEHFQFMTDVDRSITSIQPTELGIDTTYPAFKAALSAEEIALRAEAGSLKSKPLDQLDKLRDKTWQAILLRVKAAKLSPFANEAESAEVVQRIIDKYGDVRSLSYNEETAAITNLVTDLQATALTDHLNRLVIQRWVAELKNENEKFQALFNERNTELAGRPSGDVRAVRLQIDPLYTRIVDKINASIVLEIAKPAAITFISLLNEKIKYYKTTLVSRETKANETTAAEENKNK